MRAARRGLAASLAGLLTASLVACAPALPETVVPGTVITVAWADAFTSANAAASPTAGNTAIADTIRGAFGDVVDGEFVADESFGVANIVSDEPFTVRYDLAEPAWSDGIPLDAADLLLGWAGATGYFAPSAAEAGAEADPQTTAVAPEAASPVPVIDEFARAIEVTFPQPLIGWQQAVTAPVPAHVVGSRALGIDDPMEAKQAVIRAIQEDDRAALGDISEVWYNGFDVSGGEGRAVTMLSSGPFLIQEVTEAAEGQSITLVPNPAFRGAVTPRVARIELVPPGATPLAEVGTRLDIAVLAPTTADSGLVRELERQDFTVNTSHDDTAWALLLNTAGVFTTHPARVSFIRAVAASDLVERGSGLWSSAYTKTASMLSAPGSRAYDIVVEDSGFLQMLGTQSDDPSWERAAAGVPAGTGVCVLYDRASEFATGAFAALRESAAEAGWIVNDCGADDYPAALAQRGWDVVIARTPVPQSAGQLASQWGSGGAAVITGGADAQRDALIAQYAQTTDVYDAREILAQIEATIVQSGVALPLATNPLVTVIDRQVTGVATRNGAPGRLLSGAAKWETGP